MIHPFRSLFYMSLAGGFVSLASAADQTWTGQISDSMCGGSHTQMIGQRNKELQSSSAEPDRDCTLACIKQKGKYVFVVKGKVYKIGNQNLPALQTHAGHRVQLTGAIEGDTITVSKIALPTTEFSK